MGGDRRRPGADSGRVSEERCQNVGHAETVPGRGASDAVGSAVRVALPVAGRGAPQQAGSGSARGPRTAAGELHGVALGRGTRARRAVRQLRARLHPGEAGRRHRAHPLQEVHALHDDARRELRRAAPQARRRLQHLLPHHQLPHRADVQAQARRLRHLLHGGDRQGDQRDEAGRQRQGPHLLRGVPQTILVLLLLFQPYSIQLVT